MGTGPGGTGPSGAGFGDRSGRSQRVLVVGPYRMVSESLAGVLKARGLVARQASFDSAADVAERFQPTVLIVHMGRDVAAVSGGLLQVRAAAPDAGVVLVCEQLDGPTAIWAVEIGVRVVLGYGADLDELIEAVIRGNPNPSAARATAEVIRVPPLEGPTSLTEREIEVLREIILGHSSQEIAAKLGISRHTARTHVQNILVKLGAHNRFEATAIALRDGLLLDARAARK